MTDTTTARAWRFIELGGPEVLSLAEHELRAPGEGEVLLELHAAGLNRSDLAWVAGHYIKQPSGPAHLGQEGVGTIRALGPGARSELAGSLEVGQRVALLVGRIDFEGMGTFRTAGLYPAGALLPVPTSLSDAEGAALWVAALTASGGLRAGHISPETAKGRKVVVTAASSGVGVVALQLARAWGAEPIAVTTSPEKVAALEDLGASKVVVSSRDDPSGLGAALLEATDGEGFATAFDPIGFANAAGLFEGAGVGGQIVLYGIMAGPDPGSLRADLDVVSLLRKNASVHGFTIYRLLRPGGGVEEIVSDVVHQVEAGRLSLPIAKTFPLDAAPDAMNELARDAHVGKIILDARR